MKFAGADLLVCAGMGWKVSWRECVLPMLGNSMGAILKLQTWWAANGDMLDLGGREVWDDSKAQALRSDAHIHQPLILQWKEDTVL